jgi:hypothetical protein
MTPNAARSAASWSASPTAPSPSPPRPTRCPAPSAPSWSHGCCPWRCGSTGPLAYGFRTISQLGIGYRHSPAVQEGRPTLRRGPKAGDRLPDARITRDGQPCWLGEALATPRFHLLLCGPVGHWDASQLTALREGYVDLLAVHHLTREAIPGALHDLDGQAFTRLGVTGAAQYLIRLDGHIGYRCGGTDLDGLGNYLTRWLPNTTSRPA